MKYIVQIKNFYAIFIFCAFPQLAVAGDSPKIEILRIAEAEPSCGCRFEFPTGEAMKEERDGLRTFLKWDADDEEKARIRIDGELRKFSVEEERPSRDGPFQGKIHTTTFKLKDGEENVTLWCTHRNICDEKNDCEIVGYYAKVRVQALKGTKFFSATGSCGC
ncbi:hypothetical protein GTP46_08785 [Duganella sp. FT135W]|uniref:Uncharacterized protein n=1 Tax=Duganella flavida TaxID=2692175 RepID=A0A6L8K945_9BURK|nr:hypothetical protein [Duganella flavida]MYM22738.1 hypothetical protein [Duganella flavida]